jgi:RNA polymerase sigma factor (sigma-70 family)
MPKRLPKPKQIHRPFTALTESERALVAANVGLVWSRSIYFARRWGISDSEELAGEGWIGLMRAARGFNPALGFQFSTYAVRAIDRAILQANRARNTPRRGGGRVREDFTRAVRWRPDPRKLDGQSADAAYLWTMGPRLLEARSWTVLMLRMQDWTLEGIGQAIGVTRERVRQIQNRALAELREHFEEVR